MKKEETIIQDKIIDYLDANKIFHIRYNAQSSKNGISDLLICYRGYFIGAELKTDSGTPTDLQLRKLESIRQSGGVGVIIRSLDDLLTVFKQIDLIIER